MKESNPDPDPNREVEKDAAKRMLRRLRILLLLWLLSFIATIIWFALSAAS